MSNFLEQLVNDKTANDTQWREQMQAERDNTSAMQTAGINEITSNPEAYGLYLDLQGNNPTYSAGNLALVMLLKPEATAIGTRERWKLAGRSILDSEVKNSVKIFARSPTGKGYILADAYDVTQTAGRPIKQITLEDGSKAMEEATKRLLNFSAAPLAINKEMEMSAYYDEERMELNINPNYPDHEAFAAIAAEVAHSRFHAKGRNVNYAHELYDLDAQSVSYILCKHFGIERELPDLSRLQELYEGWEPEERKSGLNCIQEMSKQISGSIERGLESPQRSRYPTQRMTR